MNKPPNLNERERQMLDALAAGEQIKQISKAMRLEYTTARTYLSEVYKKIGVANKEAAIAWWTAHKAEQAQKSFRPYFLEGNGKRPLKPTFEFAADVTFGDHALENGLLAAMGSFSVYVGQNVRNAQCSRALAPLGKQNIKSSALQWLYERMMARDWETALAKWAELDEDLKDRHSCVVVECIHLLMGKCDRPEVKFEDYSNDLRMLNMARKWLAEGTPGAAEALEDQAAKDPVGSRSKHLALITLFFGFESQGDQARAADAANALMVDVLAGRAVVQEEASWDFVPAPSNKRDTNMAPITLPLSRKKVAV